MAKKNTPIWNFLPLSLRTSISMSTFKHLLKYWHLLPNHTCNHWSQPINLYYTIYVNHCYMCMYISTVYMYMYSMCMYVYRDLFPLSSYHVNLYTLFFLYFTSSLPSCLLFFIIIFLQFIFPFPLYPPCP